MNHLDDDAELYALGLTDRERDAEIEQHLNACTACRDRVVAAESAAASLAATLPAMPAAAPRRAWWTNAAAAAALVFAVTTAAASVSARTAAGDLARNDAALLAIVSSHFGHTTLTAQRGIVAKALYARDGAWIYVVAQNAPRGAHLELRTGSALRDLGALGGIRDGAPATLFVTAPGRADDIRVIADGVVVAHGAPVY